MNNLAKLPHWVKFWLYDISTEAFSWQNYAIIGSDNGVSLAWRQAIIWPDSESFLIGLL